MSELPKGWTAKKLADVAEVNMGQSPKGEFVNQDMNGMPFYQGKAEFGSVRPSPRKWCTKPTKVAEKGDILMSIRAPVGPTNYCPEKSCIGRGLAGVRAYPELHQHYLFYFFKSIEPWLSQQGTGSTFKAISGKFLRDIDVKLAPLEEQKRIAGKLDSVLAKVETAQARLDKIPAILKRFRQSVLTAATSGELTREWREEHGVDIDDWKQSTLSEVSICLDPNPSHRYPKADSSGVPILSTQQFVGLDSWTTDKSKLVSRDFFHERKEKTKFLEDDIIFARKGRLGLARMAPKGFDYVYSHTVFIVRASGINKEYLLWLLRQEETVNWLLKEMNSNTGVPTLGKAIFEKLPVPLPCEKEQVAIVDKVSELFEHAETVEKQYNAAKIRLDKLTQSILAKAFRGELVS